MGKTIKRKLAATIVGSMKSSEKRFTEMAQKGWLLEKMGSMTERYKAIEPCKKQFYVDVLPTNVSSSGVYPINEEVKDYRAICEESGWEFIASSGAIHVFCADENAPALTPIHTDTKIQAQVYLKACWKYELFTLIILNLFLAFACVLDILIGGIEIFMSNAAMLILSSLLLMFIAFCWVTGYVLFWYLRAKIAAKLDLPLPVMFSSKLREIISDVISFIALVLTVAGAAGFFTGLILKYFIEDRKVENFLMLFIIMAAIQIVRFIIARRRMKTTGRKYKSRTDVFIIAVTVFLTFICMFIVGLLFVIFRPFGETDFTDLGDRPFLTMHDVEIGPEEDEYSCFHSFIKSSVFVPVQYGYGECIIRPEEKTQFEEGDFPSMIRTTVYQSVSENLTRRLYNSYVKTLTKDFNKFVFEVHFPTLEILTLREAAFWGAEEGIAVITPTGRTIDLILLNGKTFVQLVFNGEWPYSLNEAEQAVRKLWGLGG